MRSIRYAAALPLMTLAAACSQPDDASTDAATDDTGVAEAEPVETTMGIATLQLATVLKPVPPESSIPAMASSSMPNCRT